MHTNYTDFMFHRPRLIFKQISGVFSNFIFLKRKRGDDLNIGPHVWCYEVCTNPDFQNAIKHALFTQWLLEVHN